MKLSHVDAAGRARMVDVAEKPVTARTAVAEGAIQMSQEAFHLVAEGSVAKGDVLAVSEDVRYGGPRGEIVLRGAHAVQDVYIASADEVRFDVVTRLSSGVSER